MRKRNGTQLSIYITPEHLAHLRGKAAANTSSISSEIRGLVESDLRKESLETRLCDA